MTEVIGIIEDQNIISEVNVNYGLSVYEIAVKNGFKGTEEEYLESLKGKDGLPGKDGKDGEPGPQGPQGIPGETPNVNNFLEKIEYSKTQTFNDGSDGGVIGRAYMVFRDGTQNSIVLNCQNVKYSVPVRDAVGNFYVGNPTQVYHCSTKGYVDNAIKQLRTELGLTTTSE